MPCPSIWPKQFWSHRRIRHKYKSSFGLTKKIWTSTNYFGTCKRTRHKCNLIFGLAKTIWNGPKCFGICRRTRNLPNLMFDEFLTILMYVEVLFPTTPIDTTFIRWNFSRIFRNKQNFQEIFYFSLLTLFWTNHHKNDFWLEVLKTKNCAHKLL